MMQKKRVYFFWFLAGVLLLASCAKMGQPDGGWYDETPPRVVKTFPADRSTDVDARRIHIYFNEFITVDNPTEKVVISPPQLETPEIKGAGKKIEVKLNDSLKANTTYTIDFSDAIADNNEGNPMGNYTYSFSTGASIDTLEVSGYVLEAENLEPVKGILVGLYADTANVAFTAKPMLRVARTDSRGRFVIKGIAAGSYRIYALKDADGNYRFNQKSEMLAFSHEIITPTFRPDIRQDTIWQDSLRIKNITQTPYTRFLPDDVVLRAFTEQNTDRYFLKSERKEPNRFTLYFSYGGKLPRLEGLNFDARDAFFVEASPKNDTLTYWLKDSSLINRDSLEVQMKYLSTDSTGVLQEKTDTLQLIPKLSYERRQKLAQQAAESWKKKQEKAKKKGEAYDSVMPRPKLMIDVKPSSQMAPDKNLTLTFETPVARVDTSKIHLYSKHDTLWYVAKFRLEVPQDTAYAFERVPDSLSVRRIYKLLGEWKPGIEYSLEMDSLAFTDIYGDTSGKEKIGFKVKSIDEYGTLLLTLSGMQQKAVVVQLLNNSDKVVQEVATKTGVAEFFYIDPGTYYLRMFEDENRNGRWDTGDYPADRQPEAMYYYPEKIECKAKWDITQTWNPLDKSLTNQKPSELVKQKADAKKTIKNRNFDRARQKGLEYIPRL